ncbi:hypothetical protein AOLI_G00244190 [Acnodon oligacanthus]
MELNRPGQDLQWDAVNEVLQADKSTLEDAQATAWCTLRSPAQPSREWSERGLPFLRRSARRPAELRMDVVLLWVLKLLALSCEDCMPPGLHRSPARIAAFTG